MEAGVNGGFPEPLAAEPVRLVRCHHDACGGETRVRLPGAVSTDAVRRVVCDQCRQAFECDANAVLDLGVIEPNGSGRAVPDWLADPQSPAWKYLSIPIAAALVIGALILIQGWT